MEWGIINYDSKSEGFSARGDSGSVVANIRGHIDGMLTGGSGKMKSSDMTYATPFWWPLERMKANGFPSVHLGVVTQMNLVGICRCRRIFTVASAILVFRRYLVVAFVFTTVASSSAELNCSIR